MQDLDGKTVPIGSLLSQEFFFRVPEYQRPFSWEADNFDDLIDDVITASKDQEYFLGTIVLHKKDDKGNYDVVDGQQRLTSLMILLACLRDKVSDHEFKDGIQAKILQRKNVVDGIPEKIRLEVKDREIFSEIVLKEGGTLVKRKESALPEPEWRYVNAVNIFQSKLHNLNEEETKTLITFLNQKCVVIYLATSTFDDAFRLFTIVNDRGKQLRRIDVLKSINIAPDVVTKETVRNRIAQTWEELEKELGEATFENVFHLVRLVLLKDKPQGDLLKEFENRVFAKGTLGKGEPFVNFVFDFIKLYKSVFDDRDIVPEDTANHNRYRAIIHIMNSEFRASEWRACVLYFVHRFGGKYAYNFCLKIEKVYLAQWVQGVRKDERYADYAKILGLIESAKKPEEVIKNIEYDANEIKNAVARTNIYNAGFCKYVLLRLELVAAEHDAPREFSAKSVEHVLPQAPDTKGYWANIHQLGEIDEYVNQIGNLVLLSKSKNSSARNFDFHIKKERYLKQRVSDYPRSIEILGYDDWKKETILKRTIEAKEKILMDP
ncbi:MAG: DUF262 domain-containing protein [Deferribacteres bacterium]|nr:DUF262 domain-containing protein [Deferribacteres bacterium]